MSKACYEAFAEYDAHRLKRFNLEKRCSRLRRNRNNLARGMGLSFATIIAIAAVLSRLTVSLPALIAVAINVIGWIVIFMGLAAVSALVVAIIAVIRCDGKVEVQLALEASARKALIEANVDDPKELRDYLSTPGPS